MKGTERPRSELTVIEGNPLLNIRYDVSEILKTTSSITNIPYQYLEITHADHSLSFQVLAESSTVITTEAMRVFVENAE